MAYIIEAILGCLSLFAGKSKFILYLVFIFIVILLGFNYENSDYLPYQSFYETGVDVYHVNQPTEPLFLILFRVLSTLGLNYQCAVFVIGLIGMAPIFIVVSEYSPYPALALFLYSLYPLTADVIQLRNFLADSFIVLSVIFLIKFYEDHRSIRAFQFLACMVIATGVHSSSIAFSMLFILFFHKPRKSRLALLLLIVPCIFVTLVANSELLAFATNHFANADKVQHWLLESSQSTLKHTARILLTRGGVVVLLLILRKEACAKCDSTDKLKAFDIMLIVIWYIFIISSVLEICYGPEFQRLFRPGITLCYVVMTGYIEQLNNYPALRFALYLTSVSVFVAFATVWTEGFGEMARALFENNLII